DLTGDSSPSSPRQLHTVNGHLVFIAGSGQLGLSDGTAAGTSLVPGSSVLAFAPRPLGNQLFFFSQPDSAPSGLWKTDGTEAGTVLVSPHDPVSSNEPPVPSGGKVFYGLFGATSYDLWVSDGTAAGTMIGPGLAPHTLTDANGTLFFSAFQPALSTYT